MEVESISDNVRKYLADCISKGDFCPGQQIKEQEVASQLGISRPPVREALKLLERDGLIVRFMGASIGITAACFSRHCA